LTRAKIRQEIES